MPITPRTLASVNSLELPEEIDLHIELANVGSRGLAYMIDWLLSFMLPFLGELLLALIHHPAGDWLDQLSSTTLSVYFYLFFFGSQWVYYNVFEWAWNGQTPGKYFLGLRVIKIDGSPIGAADVFLRNLVRPLDTFFPFSFIGLSLIFFTPKSQRLGDILAQTLVVREVKIDWSIFDEPVDRITETSTLRLSPEQWEILQRFLHRRHDLESEARKALAASLRQRWQSEVEGSEWARLTLSDEDWLVELARRC